MVLFSSGRQEGGSTSLLRRRPSLEACLRSRRGLSRTNDQERPGAWCASRWVIGVVSAAFGNRLRRRVCRRWRTSTGPGRQGEGDGFPLLLHPRSSAWAFPRRMQGGLVALWARTVQFVSRLDGSCIPLRRGLPSMPREGHSGMRPGPNCAPCLGGCRPCALLGRFRGGPCRRPR